jgi:hypothetical protein
METITTGIKTYDLQPGRRYGLILFPDSVGWQITEISMGSGAYIIPLIVEGTELANLTTLDNNSLQIEFLATGTFLHIEISGTFRASLAPVVI